MNEAAGSSVARGGWCLSVGTYRFFVHAREVAAAHEGTQACALHHAPTWMAGAALLNGRPTGVIDLGRFLGLARAQLGPWLIPSPAVGTDWVLQVHGLEPVQGVVLVSEPALAAQGAVPSHLAQRRAPSFHHGSVMWTRPNGASARADVLSLADLLRHPRIRGLQS